MTFRRRKSDHNAIARLKDSWRHGSLSNIRKSITDGDIDVTLLFAGAGLLLWVFFGLYANRNDLTSFANMFPLGGIIFWTLAYVIGGIGCFALVATKMNPTLSIFVGGWLTIIWSWSFFARSVAISTQQTGNATSMIYIILGLLIIHRSGRKYNDK